MPNNLNYIDLFAGAGGLSEGFIKAGFCPITHVEADEAACFTLKTRTAYHWLKKQNSLEKYNDYLHGNINRSTFYQNIPKAKLNSVICSRIAKDSLSDIFNHIDNILDGHKVNLLIGGPPCQAYSIIGRARDKNGMSGDKRNYLFTFYGAFLKRYQPKYFVFENVTGLLSAKDSAGHLYFDNMRALFRKAGYETEFKTLSADDFGVPQSRNRVILVGKRGKSDGFFPEPKKWQPPILVRDILSDLPALKAGEGTIGPCKTKNYSGSYLYEAHIKNDSLPVTWHQARPNSEQDLEIYRIAVEKWNSQKCRLDYNAIPEHLKTHKNRDSFTDRFKVVAADLPSSHTVVAHIAKDGHYYIHPDIKQNRSITPREAARIQTFPDDYFFESVNGIPSRTPTFRQIGNAVPVLFAYKIAEKLMEEW
jgi:DNA (cytosine-5)-methyltransferase 1